MTIAPTAQEAKQLAEIHNVAGVAILMLTRDGKVAFSHHGMTRYFGSSQGWLSYEQVKWIEDNLIGLLEGKTELSVELK